MNIFFKNLRIYSLISLYACICFSACSQFNKTELLGEQEKGDNAFPVQIINSASISEKDLMPLYRSKDHGSTWEAFSRNLPQKAIISGILASGNQIYITTDQHGVFFSNDGENDWKSMNRGLPETVDINAITILDTQLIIGTFHQGIWLYNQESEQWIPASKNLIGLPIRALTPFEDKCYAGTDEGVYISEDMGKTWTHQFGKIQINGFTILKNRLYAAVVDGAIVQDQEKNQWDYIYQKHTLHDISTDGQYLYAMTLGDGLLQSANQGKTWVSINLGLDPIGYYTFEVKNLDKDLYAAQHFGIYQSKDQGKTWIKQSTGFPQSTAFLTLETTAYGILTGVKTRGKK